MSKKDKYLQNKYQKRNYLKENLHTQFFFVSLQRRGADNR